MPSHQDRVRQNYCVHVWPDMDLNLIEDFPELEDGRKCVKCGISHDKVYRRKILFITNPNPVPDWIRKQFIE